MEPNLPGADPYQKPAPDLFTVMLVVALLALIVGALFLYWEVAEYGPKPFTGAPTAMLPLGGDSLSSLLPSVHG